MPLKGIVNTARSLSYYLQLQEVTANNLANVNSDAFKTDRLTARALPKMDYPTPVQKTDLRQGTFRETGRPLDLSLDGPGFLVVRTAHGERLTRGGSMKLDSAGMLTDSHGDPLLGLQGPMILSGGEIEVQNDGTVVIDGAVAGRLRIETVEDPGTLRKEGNGRYITEAPHLPVDENTRARQGAVEEPNLDPLLSMVDLITIQRAYSANLDALKAMDSVLGNVTTEVGKF